MAAAGELLDSNGNPFPMPTAAIFADVQDEPDEVYRWIDTVLKPNCEPHFPILTPTRGKLSLAATTPRTSKKSGNVYTKPGLPVFILKKEGEPPGRNPRHCTGDYKIEVVHKAIKEVLGIRRAGKEVLVHQWIGISTDEAHRMKDSQKPWIKNVYPLIEMNMSREDCIAWLDKKGFTGAPRSACTYCPFHSDAEWLRIKSTDPKAFAQAVDVERKLQAICAMPRSAMKGKPFLHRSCIPIDQVKFAPGKNEGQFGNECCGVCGV